MPTLSLETLRETPWHVLTHRLPANPSPLLLRLAALAASYLRRSEYVFMIAARSGDYIPEGWQSTREWPDPHEESEQMYLDAEQRLTEFRILYEVICGAPLVI